MLAIIYFVPVFSPDSRAYTCAQLAGSHILLATRPLGSRVSPAVCPSDLHTLLLTVRYASPTCRTRPVACWLRALAMPRNIVGSGRSKRCICREPRTLWAVPVACAPPPVDPVQCCMSARLRLPAASTLRSATAHHAAARGGLTFGERRKWTDELKNSKFCP